MELVLGIDLGTHGVRTLVADARGVIHGQGARSYERRTAPGGIQEQPLGPMWQATCKAVRDAVAPMGTEATVVGLALTHQRGTVAVLDKDGQPLGPAICDSDTRSWPQARWLDEYIGAERLFQTTGCPPVPFVGLPKILWWHQEMPDKASSVATWASIQDWAILRLTGQRIGSPGTALRLGVLDVTGRTSYAEKLLAELDLDAQQFVSIREFGETLGKLLPQAAEELALSAGTPVFPAPGDQPAAILGTGAAVGSDAAINLGTSFLTSFPLDSIDLALARGASARCTLEVLPDDAYALELGSGAGTNVLDWLRETLLELPSVEALNEMAERSVRGAHGVSVVPHWWSALGSSTGMIRGLQATHGRADIVRATLEGLAYEVRWAWEQLEFAAGRTPDRVALFGGASQDNLLCQMLADVLQRPTYCSSIPEASALGAAMCAAIGVGWFASTREVTRSMTRLSREFEPQREDSDFYEDSYQDYLLLRSDSYGDRRK